MNSEATSDQLRPVLGFEDTYHVSEYGRVLSVRRGRFKSIAVHPKTGYWMVILGKGVNRYVHRLVAEAFHADTHFNGAQVNHIDGDKNNNHYSNLEWVTRSQNIRHGFSLGLLKSNLKDKFLSLNSKAKEVVAIQECSIIEFGCIKECSNYIGGNYVYLANIIVDSGKTYRGYKIYSI